MRLKLRAGEKLYINGAVITVDASKPYAEAFAVTNGRFSAVGTTAEIRRLATPTRLRIHASLVSKTAARSSLVTTLPGWYPPNERIRAPAAGLGTRKVAPPFSVVLAYAGRD